MLVVERGIAERERGELGRGPCMFHSLAVSCSRVSGEDKAVSIAPSSAKALIGIAPSSASYFSNKTNNLRSHLVDLFVCNRQWTELTLRRRIALSLEPNTLVLCGR